MRVLSSLVSRRTSRSSCRTRWLRLLNTSSAPPYKGNELEDLEKACFWLNEFLNTPGFWTDRGEEDPERTYCRPTLAHLDAAFYAAAWALFSQCPILQAYLCGAFPGRLTMRAVSGLLHDLQARVRELKIDAGIDPIASEKQEDKR